MIASFHSIAFLVSENLKPEWQEKMCVILLKKWLIVYMKSGFDALPVIQSSWLQL